ncbi:MAG: type VI secretion system baseplate subunit TssK [Caulobacteraceae bacterium]|nr:type VI secretion system baseplate subunit TssK [Caulobacteraceae bacterium]
MAWREGLFLRPQHFQQQDRFVTSLVQERTAGLTPYPWGLSELVINDSLAQIGQFAVERCVGVLADGQAVNIPANSPPPTPITLPADLRDTVISLTLPSQQPGVTEFADRGGASGAMRFVVDEEEVFDTYSDERVSERIEVAHPNFTFGYTREQTDGRVTLPLAKVREVSNGRIVFDDHFIPPTLDIRASRRLSAFITDILGRADQRVTELAVRAVEATDGGAETFASFLLLQALNRWAPLLAHQASLPNVHPERLYETFVSMAGELATLTLKERRPPPFPRYDHQNPQQPFETVFDLLQGELSALFERSAGQLHIEAVGPGAYTARIDDHSLFQTSSFYLAASARVPPEALAQRLRSVVKIGSVVKMHDIVSSALQAGVRISPTPTPPPQIKILPGYVYFELDRSSPDWRDLATAPAIGMHVAGDWPELKLELWWVKRAQR